MTGWLFLFSYPQRDTSRESYDLLLCMKWVSQALKGYTPWIWAGLNLASLSWASVLPCHPCPTLSPEEWGQRLLSGVGGGAGRA